MSTSSKISHIVTLCSLAVAPLAVPVAAHALPFVSSQTAGELSSSSIVGLRVENAAGDKLGDINYLVLDSTGKVTTAVIGVGGFLGVGQKNVGVPYSELKFSVKDGQEIVIIDATKESLTSAPSYVWTEKSTMQKLKDDAARMTEKAKEAAGAAGQTAPSDK